VAYCVESDITGRLPKIADGIGAGIIAGYIAGVDAFIDGKLAKVYVVPFISVPAIIKEISIRLTCCRLIVDTQQNYADEKATDPLKLCGEAELWLDQIIAGDLDIGVDKIEEITTTLAGAGLGIHNVPVYKEDETETVEAKKSKFYLPGDEPPA